MTDMARQEAQFFALFATLLLLFLQVRTQAMLLESNLMSTECLPDQVASCRMNCPRQFQDTQRYLCPCYSMLGQCLVRIGCSLKQRLDVAAFCSRKGYCKDGYCIFRAGDLIPRPEVYDVPAVETPGTPCIDNCCPTWTNCSQDLKMLAVRDPGRVFRKQEVLLPPREGDPRLGVNQNYDRMPYSIPLLNIP
ncbi:RxLR-like protein [Plasmopara halstedii]|uniref:RxLR-like protein n=1 Tax=Plasmopara halstedii TaxID=4781 RepID=A0A0P1ASS7_PLAHL|nr:RxLR-like protein [Plasmopara halstedii]CEG43850.1 RxLR-like protein [Plasmopara halstedii]|eukprot:XP_024580219.1 RxLR-like protein [Plasmopara halstedii]